jgi:integrase
MYEEERKVREERKIRKKLVSKMTDDERVAIYERDRIGVKGRMFDKVLMSVRLKAGYPPDRLTDEEIDDVIKQAGRIDHVGLYGDAWQCLFSMFWVFGARIGEVVRVLKADCKVIDDEYLQVMFNVEKKRGEENRFAKLISIENPYVKQFILPHTIRCRSNYLFSAEKTKMGYIYPKYVWDVIQKMEFKQPVWSHLFRHTLASDMADHGIDPHQMKTWFSWSSIAMADTYVTKAGMNTKALSDRKW